MKDQVPPLCFVLFRQGNRLGFLHVYLRTRSNPKAVTQVDPMAALRSE